MRILIEATTARIGGGKTYIEHILPALLSQESNHQYYILISPRYQAHLAEHIPSGIKVLDFDFPATPRLLRWIRIQRVVPKLVRTLSIDLLYTTADISVLKVPCPMVNLAQNLNYHTTYGGARKLSDKIKRKLRVLGLKPLVSLSLRRANAIIFVSNAFREFVLSRLSLDREKTYVIHHGLPSHFWIEREPSDEISEFYLLAVSTVAFHKNYNTLISAFAQFLEKRPGLNIKLVIAGDTSNTLLYRQLLEQSQKLGVRDKVDFLGAVAPRDLPPLYAGATAFILPSKAETFGFPLIEAMASGVPVIASDLPVCREVCGDAACYFPPNNLSELVSLLTKVVDGQNFRNELRHKGKERSRFFSWDSAAQRVLEIFESVNHG